MTTAASPEASQLGGTAPSIGAVVGGKYRIEREIGRGGMGIVYLATQDAEPREVVVKTLAPEALARPGAVARFDREARSLQALRHSNIVEMFDFGRDGEHSYLVMEYLEGEALDQYVARKGRLTLEEFVPIAAQILKGVGFAHTRDLVIRDIKPAHVMLGKRGRRANFVKLLDFGLAKLLSEENPITSEFALGTVGFIAPEVLVGAPSDLRVDVFALGVLFYFMLSGEMPKYVETEGGPYETVVPLGEALPAGHGFPEALLAMVHACLERDPGARPGDANEVVEFLIDAVPATLFKLPLAGGARGAGGDDRGASNPNTGVIEFELSAPGVAPSDQVGIPVTAPVGAHELDSPITTEVYKRGRRGALLVGLLVGGVAAAGAVWIALGATPSTGPASDGEDERPVAAAALPEAPGEEVERSAAAVGAVDLPLSVKVPAEAGKVEDGADADSVAWSIVVLPEGAHVTLDGSRVEDAPYSGMLTVGKHSVTVEADGYEAWSGEVEVVAGGGEPLTVELDALGQRRRGRRAGRRAGRTARPESPSEASTPTANKPPPVKPPPGKSSVLLPGSKKKKSVLLSGESD